MVNLTAIALAGALFFVTDFQGHVLDDANALTANGNPVIGQVKNAQTTLNQEWSLVATSNPTQYNIQNGFTNTFLSYCSASVYFAQAAIESTPRSFNIIQSTGTIGQFNILDVATGLALTAWPVTTVRSSTITPVTYEPLVNGAVTQRWTFVSST